MPTTPSPRRAPPRSRRALVLVALAAAAGCRGAAELEADPARLVTGVVATCASAVRDVQIRRAGQATWEPAVTGAILRGGDELKTGPSSSARIALLAGGTLEVEESAAVVVDVDREEASARGARPLPRASAPEGRVAVNAGVVRGILPRPQGARSAPGLVVLSADGSSVRIASRTGEDPTAFRLVKQEIGTELAIVQGAASVRGARGDTVLAAGNAAVVRAGALAHSAPLAEAPPLLAPEMDARFQLVPGLAVRLRWQAAKRATGYRVQIARDVAFRDVEAVEPVEGTDYVFVPQAPGEHVWRVAARDDGGRYGEYGPSRRIHCEERAPQDLLERPADAAVVRSAEAAPQITFSWRPADGASSYRLVLARSPELLADQVTSVAVPGPRGVVEVPRPGEYWWGVYVESDRDQRPLFTRPRRLTVVRKAPEPRRATATAPAPAPALEVPRAISQWGG